MSEITFSDLLSNKDGITKGPFGSDIKKSLFIKKEKNAYKVYEQGVVINNDINYGNYYISEDHFKKKLKRFEIKPKDILVTGAGTLGELFIVDKIPHKGVINQALIRIRLNEDIITPHFFKYYFKYYIKHVLNKANGNSVIPNLPPIKFIKKTQIKIPSKKDQSKIENFLETIEKKIKSNEIINEKILSLINNIYDYWFLQFNFPNKNNHPYYSNDGKMIWNDQIKSNIPLNWSVLKLKEIIIKEKSTNKVKNDDFLLDGKIPVIDQSNKFISGYTNEKKYLIEVEKPVIIFGDHTRNLKLINFNFARGADGTKLIISKNKKISQNLLYIKLKKIDLSNFGYARHFKFLKNCYVTIPDESVAKKFDECTSDLFQQIHLNTDQNIQLKKLQNWLLPYLMEGKLKDI